MIVMEIMKSSNHLSDQSIIHGTYVRYRYSLSGIIFCNYVDQIGSIRTKKMLEQTVIVINGLRRIQTLIYVEELLVNFGTEVIEQLSRTLDCIV